MSNIIHCRIPADLLEKIDEQVEQLRADGADEDLASRSGVVRILLARALGEDSAVAITREVLGKVYAVLQQTAREVLERTQHELLPAAAAEAFSGAKPAAGRGVSGTRRKRR